MEFPTRNYLLTRINNTLSVYEATLKKSSDDTTKQLYELLDNLKKLKPCHSKRKQKTTGFGKERLESIK